LKAELETEAYLNENGYYAIKQEATSGLGEDMIIELTPSQMRALVRHMQHHIKIRDEWFQPVEVE
jgi:hypothetical protein